MRFSEAVYHMSKLYLDKVVSSFTKNIKKLNEEESRDLINKNIKDITSKDHISKKFNFGEYDFIKRNIMLELVIFLLLQREYKVNEKHIFKKFNQFIKNKLKQIKNLEVLNNIDERAVDLVETLFEVIQEDKHISSDEERILLRLQKKLDLNQLEFRSIVYHKNKFNLLKNFSDSLIDEGIKELMNLGLVLYLNKDVKERCYLIPEQISLILTEKLGYPLDIKAYYLLFKNTSKKSLADLAKKLNLTVSGTKEELIDRFYYQGYSAYKLLEKIGKKDLQDIARSIEDIKISGTKDEVINNIIKFFFKLDTNPVAKKSKLKDSDIWEYYEDIANRNYNLLRQLGIIKKDLEIEHLFEKLTVYGFEKLGNLKTKDLKGSNRADGCIETDKGIIYWDNKSQESPYEFPNKHQKQFLQYIKASDQELLYFLVITNDIEDTKSVEANCIKLSGLTNINIGVISARTLKNFLEEYNKENKNKALNIQLFNHNGVITKEILKMRFGIFR
ncbi:hypothetical protein GF362_00055 [Candidatus Dojkabacteria bacterium]|nr:hypothetical protein [Candidatus Dojkabacteria bacterium]